MHISIKQMSTTLSQFTHNLQRNLYVSVVTETVIGMTTTSIPITICIFAVLFTLPYTNRYVDIGMILVGSQITLSTMAQCYFIAPFRKAIIDLFRKILRRKNQSYQVVQASTQNGSLQKVSTISQTNNSPVSIRHR